MPIRMALLFMGLVLVAAATPAAADDWPAGCPKPRYSWNPLHWAVEEAAQKAWCDTRAKIDALTVEDIQRIKAEGPADPRKILLPGLAGIPGLNDPSTAGQQSSSQSVKPVLDGSATR